MKHSIAGIVIKDSKVLVMKRLPKGALASKWEFPGGKLEEGESPAEAMEREWQEELEVSISMGNLLAKTGFSHDGHDFTLHSYQVFPEHENWTFHEHSEALWVDPQELYNMDIAESDMEAVRVIFPKA